LFHHFSEPQPSTAEQQAHSHARKGKKVWVSKSMRGCKEEDFEKTWEEEVGKAGAGHYPTRLLASKASS
jgi:hypothetical protein